MQISVIENATVVIDQVILVLLALVLQFSGVVAKITCFFFFLFCFILPPDSFVERFDRGYRQGRGSTGLSRFKLCPFHPLYALDFTQERFKGCTFDVDIDCTGMSIVPGASSLRSSEAPQPSAYPVTFYRPRGRTHASGVGG